LILWFEDAVANELSGEEFNKRIDLDGDAVNIITMHASKGLEYPIVFCPYLSDIGKLSQDFFVYHDPDNSYKPVIVYRRFKRWWGW
jgi:exodeoxyribonuclease V beta subunit